MAVASKRVETPVERSSAYDLFTVEDETGKRIGDARSVFLVDGRKRYLQVELRGLFRHRNRIVPWELVALDEQARRISLRCRKGDVESAPDFDAGDVLEPQERRTRTHYGLPETPHEPVLEEPADQPGNEAPTPHADEAPTPHADEAEIESSFDQDHDRSVAEDLRTRTESLAAAQGTGALESAYVLEEDENEEEMMVSESQAAEPVAIADTAGELTRDVDERSRARRPEREEEDAFRLGVRSSDGWHPTFDVAEVDDGYFVAMDVPGVEADALELRIEDDVLIVSGERVGLLEGDVQRRESPSGPFRRRFQLPPHTNAEAVAAELKNGVLELRIPRSPAPEARRITLRGRER